MTIEIPQYGLKAYALLFTKYGVKGTFRQSALDWIVSISMKKKIFALLLRSGWIRKQPQGTYTCRNPSDAIKGLLEFRVPETIKEAKKPYAFAQSSAVEIWSDFSYVQRGMEKSPYFIKVLRKDLHYWKTFFNKHDIPNYVKAGTTIGEYVILIPVNRLFFKEKNGFNVEPFKATMHYAKSSDMYAYAVGYMKND